MCSTRQSPGRWHWARGPHTWLCSWRHTSTGPLALPTDQTGIGNMTRMFLTSLVNSTVLKGKLSCTVFALCNVPRGSPELLSRPGPWFVHHGGHLAGPSSPIWAGSSHLVFLLTAPTCPRCLHAIPTVSACVPSSMLQVKETFPRAQLAGLWLLENGIFKRIFQTQTWRRPLLFIRCLPVTHVDLGPGPWWLILTL